MFEDYNCQFPNRWIVAVIVPVLFAIRILKQKSLTLPGVIFDEQRNCIQVICNGLVATLLSAVYLIDCGCGEIPINFHRDFKCTWISLSVLASICCACGDTWASELGSVINSGQTRLITTLKSVPRGTNGGITLGGTVFSFLGGALIALTYSLAMHYLSNIKINTINMTVIYYGACCGGFGSLVDSILGATVQFSGIILVVLISK